MPDEQLINQSMSHGSKTPRQRFNSLDATEHRQNSEVGYNLDHMRSAADPGLS